jgi:hypothetical protein
MPLPWLQCALLVVRRKSLNVWSSILAPEALQIIAGGERFLRTPGKIRKAESPEGAKEYI